jgi:hypothetical protein
MAKKFYWINFFLILIVIYLAIKNYDEWTNPRPRGKEAVDAKQKPSLSPAPASAPRKGEMPPPSHYKVISEKNLFSIERKEFPPPLPPEEKLAKEKPVPPPKPPARPSLTLYGVAIVGDDLRTALVNNPYRKPEKGDRETMTVRVGDRVGEYSVGKIQEDRITMESAGDSFDVLLFDPARQKKRPAAPPTTSPPASSPTPEKPGQPQRVAPTAPRPFTPPVTPPAVSSPAPGRDLLRERLEQRRLQRPQVAPQPQVQPSRRPPIPRKEEEDDDDDDD